VRLTLGTAAPVILVVEVAFVFRDTLLALLSQFELLSDFVLKVLLLEFGPLGTG
jgi:hypothetical protein